MPELDNTMYEFTDEGLKPLADLTGEFHHRWDGALSEVIKRWSDELDELPKE